MGNHQAQKLEPQGKHSNKKKVIEKCDSSLLFGWIFETSNAMSGEKRLYGCSFISSANVDLYSIKTTAMSGTAYSGPGINKVKLRLREWVNDIETFNDGKHALSANIIAQSHTVFIPDEESKQLYPLAEFIFYNGKKGRNIALEKDKKYVVQFEGGDAWMSCRLLSKQNKEPEKVVCRTYDIDGINRNYYKLCPFQVFYVGNGIAFKIETVLIIIHNWFKSISFAEDIIAIIHQYCPPFYEPLCVNPTTGYIEKVSDVNATKTPSARSIENEKRNTQCNAEWKQKKLKKSKPKHVNVFFGSIFQTGNAMGNIHRLIGCSFICPADTELYSIRTTAMGGSPNSGERVKKNGKLILREWVNDIQKPNNGNHALSGDFIAESHTGICGKRELKKDYPLVEFIFYNGTPIQLEKDKKYIVQFISGNSATYCRYIRNCNQKDENVVCHCYSIGSGIDKHKYMPFEVCCVGKGIKPQAVDLHTGYLVDASKVEDEMK
eukprot:193192_1